MKRDKRQRRTRSIARRINSSNLWYMIFGFALIDWLLYREGAVGFAEFVAAYSYVLIAEGSLVFLCLLFGSGSIRRKLKPLDKMASAARILSAPSFDESKFRELQTAIDDISPTREDAMLITGNRELAGLEHAVNNLLKRMRDSYKQQARFVSDASHELRTPISVIQGYANMLDRWGKQDEKVLAESIDAIKAESEHMRKLVEQLLFLARGDSGKTQLNFVDVELTEMLREVLEESEMIDPKHVYELRVGAPVSVSGDSTMLKQSVRILVENAEKYAPEGSPIILSVNEKGGVARICVQDHGIGMAERDIPHVFERFYRADSSRARDTGGTGLGLSIANWIVDKHGGWFEVLSREGLGSRITICLPQKPAEPERA